MNKTIKFFLLCPVPEDQKPINEYIAAKENFFTNWTTFSPKNYQQQLFSLFSFYFFWTSTFRISSFQGTSYVFEWLIENVWWTTLILAFLFLLILSRWIQIQKRFQQARLFYEEASWYDGQIWEKPLTIIKNDRLISSQKIEPIVQRIKKTFFQTITLNFLCLFFLELSTI